MAASLTFDPVAVGRAECDSWVAYYRREWRRFLISALALVREGFRLNRRQTVQGAWYVLRAIRPGRASDNDPDGPIADGVTYALVNRAGRLRSIRYGRSRARAVVARPPPAL
jgi:hypothetical protein